MTDIPEGNWALLVDRLRRVELSEQTLAAEVDELKAKINEREQERQAEERKRLLAGISFLGSIILALFGVIWAYRAVIFQGSK
ncbi:MAG: hypothetical protein VX874_15980 [Pseudomonadota bacterium]|nr:hypothetical protein [Pseudomonadota bacterium]